MTFKIPDGWEMPPDAEEGGEFTVVGTFKDNEDGTLTLTAIDGAKIKKEREDDGDMDEPKTVYGRAKKMGMKMKGEM
jgi:hypothetical protein